MYIPVYQVMLVRDGSCVTDRKIVQSPLDVYSVLKNYLNPESLDREHFVVAMLNTKNKIIGLHTVSIGCLNASVVHPREVFKPALLSNAATVILAHNHPSGNPDPSDEDLSVTRRLFDAGKILGINVRDHIILGDDSFFSFKEKGML
jgi:DNA repair protein RadC